MLDFKQHIPSFCKFLKQADPASISPTPYVQEYLQHLLRHPHYYLEIYAAVLDKAFSNLDHQSITLLDFGTGNGMLALFAKYCGVKEVYASDISPGFIPAAEELGNQLNIQIDGWISGGEDVLPKYFENIKTPDVIVGTDVIEHVYDLDNLFDVFARLNPAMVTIFTTASVSENPFKSAGLKKMQLKDELEDSNVFQASGDNEYGGQSFLEIRKKIIRAFHPALEKKIVDELALRTRGLKKDDIEKTVEHFLQTGNMPEILKHPTNTCDPVTGSWTERILTVEEYNYIHNKYGFSLEVYNGFYNRYGNVIKATAATIVNRLVLLFSKRAIVISPFIILKGTRNKRFIK